jgi:hypothetical protein
MAAPAQGSAVDTLHKGCAALGVAVSVREVDLPEGTPVNDNSAWEATVHGRAPVTRTGQNKKLAKARRAQPLHLTALPTL